MNLKIAGTIIKENIRTILLLEADFYFSNKLYFGSTLIKREESSGFLPHEIHIGRLGHTPIEVSVLIIIFFDNVRQTKRNAALG